MYVRSTNIPFLILVFCLRCHIAPFIDSFNSHTSEVLCGETSKVIDQSLKLSLVQSKGKMWNNGECLDKLVYK